MEADAVLDCTGHEFLGIEEKDGEYRVYVRKRVDQ
jgi:TusA-related sulfurtransferase